MTDWEIQFFSMHYMVPELIVNLLFIVNTSHHLYSHYGFGPKRHSPYIFILPRYLVKKIITWKKAKETFGLTNFITSKSKQRWIYERQSSHSSINKWLLRTSCARRTEQGPRGTDTKPLMGLQETVE